MCQTLREMNAEKEKANGMTSLPSMGDSYVNKL